jgi:hypothetical protein
MNSLPPLSLLLCLTFLTNCETTNPKSSSQPSGIIQVHVTPWFGDAAPIYATLEPTILPEKPQPGVKHRLDADGLAGFVVPMGATYGVRAYADLDGNGRQDPNEPSGILAEISPLPPLGTGPDYTPKELVLPGTGVPLPKSSKTTDILSKLPPGAVEKLQDSSQNLSIPTPPPPPPAP